MAGGFIPNTNGGGGGVITLAGDVAGPSNANVIQPGVVTGGGGGKLADSTITEQNLAADAMPSNNVLTNPAFNYAQLQDPATLTTIADNTISADAWKLTRENAGVQYMRNPLPAGLQTAYSGQFKKIGGAGKIMIYQPLEAQITQQLRNAQAVFTVFLNPSAARNFQIGLAFYLGGGPNTPAPPPVAAWNGAGVLPTFNAGFTSIVNFVANAGAFPGVWSEWAVSFAIPDLGSDNNLFPYIISDSQMAVGETVDVAQLSLDLGAFGRFQWRPLSAAEDRNRVERFIEKSYDVDTVAGTPTFVGSMGLQAFGAGAHYLNRLYRVAKAINVAPTIYNPFSGAAGSFRNVDAAADDPAVATDNGLSGVDFDITASAAGVEKGHFLVNASL